MENVKIVTFVILVWVFFVFGLYVALAATVDYIRKYMVVHIVHHLEKEDK